MRVLYVDLEREWRGGQSQALLTLCGLRERGHEIELLAARDSPLANRASESEITVHQVPRLGLRGWAARAVRGLIARRRFELVHLNEPHALTAAWLARAHRRVPLLLSRRIGFPLQRNAVSQARYGAVERFIANSKNVAQSLIDSDIAAERISIVNEGVEIFPLRTPEQRSSARKHWGVREGEFLFGCVSVFVPEKGQRHLIEALPLVRALHPEVRLLLAGDGACRAELEALTKLLGQTEAVLFPGFVKEVAEVCAALGEVVDGERTALVVAPNGKEFAVAMLRLINDEGLQTKLSKAGRLEAEQRFSTGGMVENTIHVYEDVLKKRQAT